MAVPDLGKGSYETLDDGRVVFTPDSSGGGYFSSILMIEMAVVFLVFLFNLVPFLPDIDIGAAAGIGVVLGVFAYVKLELLPRGNRSSVLPG